MNRTRAAVTFAAVALSLSLSTEIGCAAPPPPPPPKPPEIPAKRYEAPDERYAYFVSGRAELVPDAYFSIGYACALLDADASLHVLVVGHADQHNVLDFARDLSLKRARVVRKAILDHGVAPGRVLVATPRDATEASTRMDLSRRADLYLYDPLQDEASQRLGYPVDVKQE